MAKKVKRSQDCEVGCRVSVGRAKQEGAILAISLLFLLILTILGVTAMGTSNIELLLGSNYEAQLKTFLRSENSLTAAEKEVPQIPPKKNNPANGVYLSPQPVHQHAFWDDSNTRNLALGGSETRYIYRYIGTRTIRESGASASTTQSYTNTSGNQLVELYRVTARSAGHRNSVRTIQSIYGTP